jgi:hypothetical protein
MDTLRTAVSLLGASDPVENNGSPAAIQAKALRLFAVLPSIVALDQRRRHGLGTIPPRDDLGFAANFLYMTFGEVPEPEIVAAFQTSLILYAEHSFNASTFTARVVASTLSNVYSAVTAAIGALKGPAARRRQRGRDGRDGRDRHRRQRRAMAGRGPRRQAKDHGIRPPCLQERRLPRARYARRAGTDRRAPRRAAAAGHL